MVSERGKRERERERATSFPFFHFHLSNKILDSHKKYSTFQKNTGPTELKHSVSGRHGFLSGALEHVSAAEKVATAAAAGDDDAATKPAVAVPTDGRVIEACDRVLRTELAPGSGNPVIKNNRGLVALFQALSYYWAEVAGDKFRGRTFSNVAETLAEMDEELGVLDSPEKFKPLCAGPKKLEGFAAGTFKRAKEWMEGGLPEELAAYKK